MSRISNSASLLYAKLVVRRASVTKTRDRFGTTFTLTPTHRAPYLCLVCRRRRGECEPVHRIFCPVRMLIPLFTRPLL